MVWGKTESGCGCKVSAKLLSLSVEPEEEKKDEGSPLFFIVLVIVASCMFCLCFGVICKKCCKKRKQVEPDWMQSGPQDTKVLNSNVQAVKVPKPKKVSVGKI